MALAGTSNSMAGNRHIPRNPHYYLASAIAGHTCHTQQRPCSGKGGTHRIGGGFIGLPAVSSHFLSRNTVVAVLSPLMIFSRPKLEMTFSEGVTGKNTKKVRIAAASAIKQQQDTTVILVDFFRLLKKPFPLLI